MLKAALWMMGAIIAFSLMAVGARELAGEINVFQILFFRSVMGLVIVSVLILSTGQRNLFVTRRVNLHIGRNIFHFAGQYGWFLGIGLLPLAEVFALEFTVPIWTVLIASVFLKEYLTARKLTAILVGVIGVLVIIRPGAQILDVASMIVLASAACFGVSYVATKGLSSSESSLTVLFYMCLIQLPVSLLFTVGHWIEPTPLQWLWVSIVSVAALGAHYCVTRAMKLAEAGVVVTLDFLRLPLIAAVGVVFYSEAFDIALILGAALMLIGNLINLHRPGASNLLAKPPKIVTTPKR